MKKRMLLVGWIAVWSVFIGSFSGYGQVLAGAKVPRVTFLMEGVAGYDEVMMTAREKAGYPVELQILHDVKENTLDDALKETSLLVVVTHGKDITRVEQFREKLQSFKDQGGLIIVPNIPEDRTIANVNLNEHPNIQKYWINGGLENMVRLFTYLGNKFLRMPIEVKLPIEIPVWNLSSG